MIQALIKNAKIAQILNLLNVIAICMYTYRDIAICGWLGYWRCYFDVVKF